MRKKHKTHESRPEQIWKDMCSSLGRFNIIKELVVSRLNVSIIAIQIKTLSVLGERGTGLDKLTITKFIWMKREARIVKKNPEKEKQLGEGQAALSDIKT